MATPTIDKVTTSWQAGAEGYAAAFEPWSTPVAIQLALAVGAHHCSSLIEVGAGTGAAAAFVQSVRSPASLADGTFRHSVSDLVAPFVAQLKHRLSPHTDVTIANGERLSHEADCTYAAYMSCLCLMITPDPNAMLTEAFRVLKPGGVAGFAVWGSKDQSPMMAIPPESLRACGFVPAPKRSNFHLGSQDESALRAAVFAAGFSSMHAWRVHAVLPGGSDPQRYIELMKEGSPSFGALLEPLQQAEREQALAEMRRRAAEVLDRGEAIGCDVLLFLAYKAAA